MDNQRGSDLLSELPVDIIEKILLSLPIRDAIKTSILSSKWRYRWVGLPELHFDDYTMGFPEGEDVNPRLKKFVTRTLSRHQGPIHKFKLHATDMDSCPSTDEWLLFLSRKHVKELDLAIADNLGADFCLPSCLYSCQNLTNLELYGCQFVPPPPAFKGFLCLRTLTLAFFDMPSATIESLVASCPLIEELECMYAGCSKLRISAPNLKYATLKGMYEISLCAPLLATLSVELEDVEGSVYEEIPRTHSFCNYTNFLGGFTNLETLIGIESFTKYLSIGIEHCHQPLAFHHLEYIRLHDVNFLDMNEILLVVRLIMDAANLSCLEVHCQSSPDKEWASKTPHIQLWDFEFPINCTFKELETVVMTGFTGAPHELHFILFLVQSSPVLETVIIRPVQTIKEEMHYLIAKWLCLCQAYTNAEILL